MKNKAKNILAEVVSRVLDPVWEIPMAIAIAVLFAVKEGLRWRFLGLVLFIDGVVPLIFFLLMLYHKQIKDWDMQNRKERVPLYLFTTICHLGGVWLAHELGKNELVSILLVFYGVAMVFLLITLKWKISLHAGVNSVLFTIINVLYGYKYLFLYVLLWPLLWARVYQKHHTIAQFVVGAILGCVLVIWGLYVADMGFVRWIDYD